MKKQNSDLNNNGDLNLLKTIAELQNQIIILSKRQEEIDKILLQSIAEKKGRVNVSSKNYDTHPHVTVYSFGLNITNSTYKMWSREEYVKFESVKFYSTNKKGVIAMEFCSGIPNGATKISVYDDTRDSTWGVHSSFLVSSVFGGVKFGDKSKYYNTVKYTKKKNTALLYDNYAAGQNVEAGTTIGKQIRVDPQLRAPKVSLTKGRIRFNNGFISKLSVDPDEGEAIVVKPEYFPGGAVLRFSAGKERYPGDYILTPGLNSGTGIFEICNLEFIRNLGIDVSSPKSYNVNIDFVGDNVVLLKVVKKEDA